MDGQKRAIFKKGLEVLCLILILCCLEMVLPGAVNNVESNLNVFWEPHVSEVEKFKVPSVVLSGP